MGDGLSKIITDNHESQANLGSNCTADEVLVSSTRSLPSDTVIIFDWDDTLLCSSAINVQEWTLEQLEELETTVEALLVKAMSLGETLIVTNGNQNWVEESTKLFLPGLQRTLQHLQITSARACYEDQYPLQPIAWKRSAFEEILTRRVARGGGRGVNLIVLGDSRAEIIAAEHVARLLGGASITKTVKFKESPTVNELLGQLRRVSCEIEAIVWENIPSGRTLQRSPFMQPAAWASGWTSHETRSYAKALCMPTSIARRVGLLCPSGPVPVAVS
jgi:hypothetical protein